MKKTIALLLALLMTVSLLPVSAFAAGPDEDDNPPEKWKDVGDVWVNGEQFSADKPTISCGSGTAAYDPAEKILTLENASIVNTYKNGGKEYGIYSDSSITVVFRGINSINASENFRAYGIYSNGSIEIVSDSAMVDIELTIDVGDTGISAEKGSVKISGGDGGDISVNAFNDGIFAGESLEIDSCGDVKVSAGYYGLFAGSGDIKIDGNNNTVQVKAEKYGIYACEGDILLTSWGYGAVNVAANEDGICACSGTVTIGGYGRNVEITSGNDGICAKAVTIGGQGKTTVKANEYGIYSANGDLTISGSGEVDIYGRKGGAALGNVESKVLLSGIGSPVAFKTNDGKKAVVNTDTGESPVAGDSFDQYKAEGEPSESSVIYTPTVYGVWVGGTQFTSLRQVIACYDGTASYDPEKRELTLDNATINRAYKGSGKESGIYSESDITIVAKGDSLIDLGSNSSAGGIYSAGCITFKGDGNLSIKAVNNGIESEKSVTLSHSGKMTVTSAKFSGIYVENGSVEVSGSGDLSIDAYYKGIAAYNGDVAFSGSGEIEIYGEKNAIFFYEEGQELRLNGIGGPITLSTGEDGTAVFCRSTWESPVVGTCFDAYKCVTGAPDTASVVYRTEHSFPADWSKHDAEQHKHICTRCETEAEYADHDFDGNTCRECEYVKGNTYTIIAGNNGEWTKGSTAGLAFTSDAPCAKFDSVKIDGSEIPATDYTAEEGSTKITLARAYLETLNVGSHSIEIVSSDGTASASFTVQAAVPADPTDPTIPETGARGPMFLWIALLLISGGALAGTAVYSKRKKKLI